MFVKHAERLANFRSYGIGLRDECRAVVEIDVLGNASKEIHELDQGKPIVPRLLGCGVAKRVVRVRQDGYKNLNRLSLPRLWVRQIHRVT